VKTDALMKISVHQISDEVEEEAEAGGPTSDVDTENDAETNEESDEKIDSKIDALLETAQSGKVAEVRLLLDGGVDVNATNAYRSTALIQAARGGGTRR